MIVISKFNKNSKKLQQLRIWVYLLSFCLEIRSEFYGQYDAQCEKGHTECQADKSATSRFPHRIPMVVRIIKFPTTNAHFGISRLRSPNTWKEDKWRSIEFGGGCSERIQIQETMRNEKFREISPKSGKKMTFRGSIIRSLLFTRIGDFTCTIGWMVCVFTSFDRKMKTITNVRDSWTASVILRLKVGQKERFVLSRHLVFFLDLVHGALRGNEKRPDGFLLGLGQTYACLCLHGWSDHRSCFPRPVTNNPTIPHRMIKRRSQNYSLLSHGVWRHSYHTELKDTSVKNWIYFVLNLLSVEFTYQSRISLIGDFWIIFHSFFRRLMCAKLRPIPLELNTFVRNGSTGSKQESTIIFKWQVHNLLGIPLISFSNKHAVTWS